EPEEVKAAARQAAALCAATPEVLATVASADLVEISGIAASWGQDGVLWAHNDSGDSARVFAMGTDGAHLGTYTLVGAQATDWEDMAMGPGPQEGVQYLYLADMGDNGAARPEVVVYRVPEPPVSAGGTPTAAEVPDAEALTLRYPDRAHDAETLLVDPVSGDIVIVTKELVQPSLIFRAPGTIDGSAPATLEQVGEIDFTALDSQAVIPAEAPAIVRGAPFLPTGGDVSPAGDAVAIRTYGTVWVWDRPEGASLAEALAGVPCEAPSVIEPQGEALAFDSDGRGYITVSEGANPPLNHFVAQ
ncbi:MAG: PE family protein, partial [Dehalococcoidia bacterium]